MVDISAVAGALGALKAANDIAQAMVGLRDAASFQAKLIEFQAKIIEANNCAFAAQDERTALLRQISILESDVAASTSLTTGDNRAPPAEPPIAGPARWSPLRPTPGPCLDDIHSSALQITH